MARIPVKKRNYIVLTLHRPSNVDEEKSLVNLLTKIDKMVGNKKVVFPIHPRTKAILGEQDFNFKNLILVNPQGYLNFMYLIKNSFAVITDSGGISEETTVLNVPCFTLRNNTERPETIAIGTNSLVRNSLGNLEKIYGDFLKNGVQPSAIPKLWDGKAAQRIIDVLLLL